MTYQDYVRLLPDCVIASNYGTRQGRRTTRIVLRHRIEHCPPFGFLGIVTVDVAAIPRRHGSEGIVNKTKSSEVRSE